MENGPYLVSARKYRPSSFEEVVGQKVITDTLSQGLKENKIASSILFSGPRGVGKTTCARILAKKLNEDYLKNPEDLSFNVFELDGASNNSVEDIRNLTQQIRFAPQKGKYKIYIIDEVHMLSQAAFNAFLKTLEEPPPYVIFILATTEKHKVLSTILSRCQIYEFRPILSQDIVSHFKKIAQKENIKVQEEALFLIASQVEGSLRDALFLFDRLRVLSSDNLTLEIIESQLGILPQESYLKIIEYINKVDIFSLLLYFDELLKKGFNMDLFLVSLAGHLRNLLLLKNEKTHHLLDFPLVIKEKLLNQSKLLSVSFLFSSLEICKKGEMELKVSKNRRLSVEITLMQLVSLNNTNLEKENQRSTSNDQVCLKTQKKEFSNFEKQNQIAKNEDQILIKKKEIILKDNKNEIKNNFQKKNCLIDKEFQLDAFSIKEALKEINEISSNNNVEKENINLPFSKKDFINSWNLFIKRLDLKKESPILSILKNVNFEIEKENKIVLYFVSRAAIAEFVSLEKEAKCFIKKELSNFSIKFIYKLNETQLIKKSIYSLEEKCEFLMKKNFFLQKLIKTFYLDYL